MLSKRKLEEKHEKILRRLLKQGGNKKCVNCESIVRAFYCSRVVSCFQDLRFAILETNASMFHVLAGPAICLAELQRICLHDMQWHPVRNRR